LVRDHILFPRLSYTQLEHVEVSKLLSCFPRAEVAKKQKYKYT